MCDLGAWKQQFQLAQAQKARLGGGICVHVASSQHKGCRFSLWIDSDASECETFIPISECWILPGSSMIAERRTTMAM